MTSQNQLDAFLQHCADIRQGYFFSFKAKKSSLRHFIEALEWDIRCRKVKALLEEDAKGIVADLKRTSPKDHVKYLPAIKSLCAVWGTEKNYVRLNPKVQAQNTTMYWNNVTGELSATPARISISSQYPGYHLTVAKHLTAISKTRAGNIVLSALAGGARTVSIIDHPVTNQCGTGSSVRGMNLVTAELYDKMSARLGVQTIAALNQVATGAKTPARWLADEINNTPTYELDGLPATAPCNLGVTEQQVGRWINAGDSIWLDFGNYPAFNQIKNAIIIALYAVSGAGAGSNSTVNYSLGTTNPLNAERPPAIGLAHEMVHAYYNMRGEQPGFEVGQPTTVLFEYRCVGLGPWANSAISENKIRWDWDDTLLYFDDDDTRDRKEVGQREVYHA